MYDIEGFIERNYTDFRYYGNPATDISICCPFCEARGAGADNKYHLQLHLDPDKQVVHCFRCGYAGTWVQFVLDSTSMPYWQAIGELYVKPRVREDLDDRLRKKMMKTGVIDISKEYQLPEDFRLLEMRDNSRLAAVARKYLWKRGFSPKVSQKYNLGIADSVGFRLIIPIERGYWQGRALVKYVTPKYLNPKEPAKDILFNVKALHLYEEVVVCEGFFSAIAIGDNAIALIGKEPTDEKLERILKSTAKRFIIALEAGAFSSMQKLADALDHAGKEVILWKYEGDNDPANSSQHTTQVYDLKAKLSNLLGN